MPNFKVTNHAGWIRSLLFTLLSVVALTTTEVSAQTLTVLYSFTGGNDGAAPGFAGVISDGSGNLYGTASEGGAYGEGTVFKLTPSGVETVLYSFKSSGDGTFPVSSLISDAAGNLYGTTNFGGTYGKGTVFKVTPSGVETVLHSFGSGNDGSTTVLGLIADASGNLYGVTNDGGGIGCHGTVFKVTPSGTETVLHSFSGSDGLYPVGTLISDSTGDLYGTTSAGGAYGGGTVFELTPSGVETVLYSFPNVDYGSDGESPFAGLVADASGNLYGTTLFGGPYGGGTVFKLTPSGVETVLHALGKGDDGILPWSGLILDAAGNLYGTTSVGGANGYGTVFEVTPSGVESILHSFSGSDGFAPEANLLADTSGNLYSTTRVGGAFGFGEVFALSTTPQGALHLLESQVNSMHTLGVLNAGQDNSLVTELDNAIRMIAAGKINGAIGNLESFITEVNDLYNSGTLNKDQASSLTNTATSVINELQAI